MTTSAATRPLRTLHGELRPVLAHLRRADRGNASMALGDVIDAVGRNGLVLAALLIVLPFVSPLSLGPITTPASLFLLFVGWQLVRDHAGGHGTPGRWRQLSLPVWLARSMRRLILRLSRAMAWHTRALPHAPCPTLTRSCGIGVMVAALLLAVPVPLLPLTNTFPALGAASFCLAILLASRRWMVAGTGFCLLGALIFVGLGAAVWMVGLEAVAGLTRLGQA